MTACQAVLLFKLAAWSGEVFRVFRGTCKIGDPTKRTQCTEIPDILQLNPLKDSLKKTFSCVLSTNHYFP